MTNYKEIFNQLVNVFKNEMVSLDEIRAYMVDVMSFDDSYDLTGSHPSTRENVSLNVIFLMDREQTVPQENQIRFQNTIKFASNVPGLIAATCIVIGPKSIVPTHLDDMERPMYDMNTWYSVLIGVDVPSDQPDLLAMSIDDAIYTHAQGTAIIFDTQIPHSAWNHTDRYWISLRLRMEKSFLENENIIK